MNVYVIDVELAGEWPAEEHADRIMDELVDYGVAMSTRPGTGPIVIVNIPAGSLRQALTTALSVVAPYGDPIGVTALEENIWCRREGWDEIPPLLSAAEAAELLGVSRQRVVQMIGEKKVPASRVGTVWAIPESAVLAMVEPAADKPK
ncbi:DNA binding domain-containing protein, excisionase family [Austwickia chelonae]|uniref:Helix-turn-helix domain-containing protein n=1 Tax=Austwickia chelonae NBRC 105200 TaxID=1184607 RepID=K6W6U5_9MICO|nr:helix-turn-helix domain-containing protein [Austwickia chelonae]GAB77542.1 hypothetical protein AUCHE_05_04540 [Austwickia chelonae NBRC 105200]SEW12521.1 DNA binding domain-containing protein, excisionase family [Austwickia chelonae]